GIGIAGMGPGKLLRGNGLETRQEVKAQEMAKREGHLALTMALHILLFDLHLNRLRVFRRAKVASLCSGGGPKRETRAVPAEKCVARWGREYDKMRMITTSFARVLARYTGHLYEAWT